MPELNLQQGSVLVTVLGLSVAMSLAAGGILLVAGNAQNDEDQAFIRQRCFNDAESGLMIGAAWLKHHGDNTSARSFILSQPSVTSTIPATVYDNGATVSIKVEDKPPLGKTVTSTAVLGNLTLKYAWDVDTTLQDSPTDGSPVLKLTNWRVAP